MKTWSIIRFVLTAVFATLGWAGLGAGIPGAQLMWVVSWLLLVGRSELTKPIPRSRWWQVFLVVGLFVAVMLTLPFFHLPPAPSERVRFAIAVPMWLLSMLAIYHRWRRENGKAAA